MAQAERFKVSTSGQMSLPAGVRHRWNLDAGGYSCSTWFGPCPGMPSVDRIRSSTIYGHDHAPMAAVRFATPLRDRRLPRGGRGDLGRSRAAGGPVTAPGPRPPDVSPGPVSAAVGVRRPPALRGAEPRRRAEPAHPTPRYPDRVSLRSLPPLLRNEPAMTRVIGAPNATLAVSTPAQAFVLAGWCGWAAVARCWWSPLPGPPPSSWPTISGLHRFGPTGPAGSGRSGQGARSSRPGRPCRSSG